jgi:hypothetical protein
MEKSSAGKSHGDARELERPTGRYQFWCRFRSRTLSANSGLMQCSAAKPQYVITDIFNLEKIRIGDTSPAFAMFFK